MSPTRVDGVLAINQENTVTANTEDLLFQKVASLLVPYNHNKVDITRQTEIMAELNVDSVMVFDLIMEVEDEYDVTFPMETVSEIKSVGELIDTIRKLKNG